MFDLFKELLEESYPTIEAYNASVMSVGRALAEELYKTERQLLTGMPDILEDLGVWVKGINNEEDI